MITGGSIGGDSHHARKAEIRKAHGETITEVLDVETMEDAPIIQFGKAERSGPQSAHNDALVITALLANYEVERIFIDFKSSADILFGDAFDQMQLGDTPWTRRSQRSKRRPPPIPEGVMWRLYERGRKVVRMRSPRRPLTAREAERTTPKKTWKLVKQKKRHFGPEKDKVIQAEIDKLMAAGHVEEIQLPEWLSNVVLVPKPDGKWRMCIDFRDLKKACPKDFYPLPRIDQLVDSTSGCELLSMMDVSQGYHQIMLALEDRKRVSFITSAGSLQHQRSSTADRENSCSQSIYIQSAEKSLPFFKVLRKVRNFEWDTSCQQAFKELKRYLAELPLLVKPCHGDTLYLYLSTTLQAVSSVLVREEEGKQMPIYYVSKVLNGAEGRYTPIENIALALVVTVRKLRPYSLTHPIGVKTNMPLKQTLGKPDTSRCLIKWAVELSEYDISYLPRTTINAQALADFVSEVTGAPLEETHKDEKWLLHVDGSSTIQDSGTGLVITPPQGEDLEFAVKFDFNASNNEAEYEALVESTYEAKEKSIVQYLQQIAKLRTSFQSFQVIQIPREENAKADCLSRLASALEDCRTRHITILYLPNPRTALAIHAVSSTDWRTPIIEWIEKGSLPDNWWDASRLKTHAVRFLV
ncbi:UNVERIFIED_CONTAM: Transposon Ty3-G Gag-Pol polyprotein [Sesamum radiatum]|uniref:Transposon Ty3-G Gag-Pol polyprotein n=1 Tax=Sesamum radiatum TaxID=300843 RepID=A0AAW2S3A0_SESRA